MMSNILRVCQLTIVSEFTASFNSVMVTKHLLQCIRLKLNTIYTAGNRHKHNSRFCQEIREDNFRFWWRRVHVNASHGMYMSKIEICFFTARILQNQRMLCCGECFHD
jgi:hypothetical protein